MEQFLQGSCACGRVQYQVTIPPSNAQRAKAQVILDNSATNRRHQAAPFTAFLRVPLEWYHSQIFPAFPDETPRSIFRTFEPPIVPVTRRQFCGMCGTPMTSWNERTREDANFISLTLGSILDEDLDKLEGFGMITHESEDDTSGTGAGTPLGSLFKLPHPTLMHRGAPWFEDMIDDSQLGRIKRQRGSHASTDGSTRVEWEVMEWTDESSDSGSGYFARSKLSQVQGDDKTTI